MKRLEGKVAIVTGGGRGIGHGITLALAKEGAKVTITGRNLETLEKTVAELKEMGLDVFPVACDGGVREQVKNVIAKTVEHYGKLDIVVNNAHVSNLKPLEELTDEDMNLSLNSGIWAVFYYMQEAFPYLKESGHGKIINFGSAAAIKGMPLQGTYAASKEAVRGLTRVATNEWGKYGICANVVCPFAESAGMKTWAKDFPTEYQAIIDQVPLKRLGDPETDIGRVVVFLASDDSNYITGDTFNVDGGGATRP